jgi:hypothetical protein
MAAIAIQKAAQTNDDKRPVEERRRQDKRGLAARLT